MTDKTYDLFSNNLKHFYNYVDGHSFDDYVSYGTYDLNKKNLIISLPEYLNIVNSTRDKNVIEIFDQIRTNYPNDKYNYIYKAHPRATQTQIEDAIKRIFNNRKEAINMGENFMTAGTQIENLLEMKKEMFNKPGGCTSCQQGALMRKYLALIAPIYQKYNK